MEYEMLLPMGYFCFASIVFIIWSRTIRRAEESRIITFAQRDYPDFKKWHQQYFPEENPKLLEEILPLFSGPLEVHPTQLLPTDNFTKEFGLSTIWVIDDFLLDDISRNISDWFEASTGCELVIDENWETLEDAICGILQQHKSELQDLDGLYQR